MTTMNQMQGQQQQPTQRDNRQPIQKSCWLLFWEGPSLGRTLRQQIEDEQSRQ